jgi:hypothetical protein
MSVEDAFPAPGSGIAPLFSRTRFAGRNHAVERRSRTPCENDSCLRPTVNGDVMKKKEEREDSGRHGDHAEISVFNKRLFSDLARKYAGKNVLLLNDEDTTKDLRVLNQYHCFEEENCNVEIVETHHRKSLGRYGVLGAFIRLLQTAWFFLRCLAVGASAIGKWRAVNATYDVGKYRNPFFGRNVFSVFLDLKDYYFGLAFPLETLDRKPDVIIANNISSLMFCKAAFGSSKADVVYDAHELSFMRFRRDMSTLRNWFGFCYEVSLGSAPHHVLTVNQPLRKIYGDILGRDDVTVICNDLYRDILVAEPQPGEDVYMAFFGSARDLRLMHRLSALATYNQALNLRFYLVGDEEKQSRFVEELFETVAPGRIKLHFGIGYQQVLADEMASGGIWMSWCAVEDACLSYRLSLPNKLIQSVRARMPSIVLEKTYISDIVDAFDVGVSLKLDGSVEDDAQAIEHLRKTPPVRSSYSSLTEQFDLNRI